MNAPTLIPPQAARLCAYIHDHGHKACFVADDNCLAVTSAVVLPGSSRASMETELIPADWQAVRDWLGY